MARYELAVVGAGPAGLAAALAAADSGMRVVLLDAAPTAGGQFYRQPAKALYARRPQRLYHAWPTWLELRDRLSAHVDAGLIGFLADRHVWHVEQHEKGFAVHSLLGPQQRSSESVAADGLVLATGGYERVLPFPGWTLPGVLTAGGAQAMLKAGLVLPGRRVVVAGSGPLLLPVAAALAAAGAAVPGLYESAAPRAFTTYASDVLANPGKLAEGAQYAARLARHGVRVRFRHAVIRAHGDDRLDAVTVARLDASGRVVEGSERRIDCDALAVSHGMLPHTEIARTLGTQLTENGCVAVDAEQRTDVPRLWAAGETTGIGGAALSLAEGEIAGRSAGARLRAEEPDKTAKAWIAADAARTRLRRFAEVIEAAYAPPSDWSERVEGDTLLCRCEEVPAAAVREAVAELGATDLRTVKLLTRAGMGWCQGRICGPGVAGVSGCPAVPARTPFARPVPLGVLAGDPDDADRDRGEGTA
ncbi:MAG TPA: FAD-dependent oxidoreductase [Actinospica sp.]|nr:FAD-dependent oxidoreductase [Actinospica sp.]